MAKPHLSPTAMTQGAADPAVHAKQEGFGSRTLRGVDVRQDHAWARAATASGEPLPPASCGGAPPPHVALCAGCACGTGQNHTAEGATPGSRRCPCRAARRPPAAPPRAAARPPGTSRSCAGTASCSRPGPAARAPPAGTPAHARAHPDQFTASLWRAPARPRWQCPPVCRPHTPRHAFAVAGLTWRHEQPREPVLKA